MYRFKTLLNVQLVSELVIIGIYSYAAIVHGIIYFRMRDHIVHGVFALLCLNMAAYALTNIFALNYHLELNSYITISKLSSLFVMLIFANMAWFIAEYIHQRQKIPVRAITLSLAPFFILNLFMEHGILWSSIEGIERVESAMGGKINRAQNPVISWPMYALWLVILGIYLVMVQAVYKSLRSTQQRKDKILFVGLILFSVGLVYDMTIDLGINESHFYLSEYLILGFVLLMSINLSDELLRHKSELETLVTQRTEKLQAANRDLESFSYSISHDLRAPLRAIKGFSEAVEESMDKIKSGSCAEYLRRIMANVDRMDLMINGLLELARVSRQEIVHTEVNLSELAQEIFNELQEQQPDRHMAVNIENDLKVNADPVLARMILVNLIDNAWKFTRQTEQPVISLRNYRDDENQNGFIIEDNGAGFDAAFADKLFVPFQRLHPKEDYPGIGIGLATIARIVKQHGGCIHAQGREGKGATFYVSLGPV